VSEIKRKNKESFEAFMRRTKKTWLQSGKLLQARKIQFFSPKKSKNLQKAGTVEYLKKQSKTDYLRKTGKLPAEDPRGRRRR